MKIVLTENETFLHMVISKETKARIKELAKENKTTMTQVVEDLVEKTKEKKD